MAIESKFFKSKILLIYISTFIISLLLMLFWFFRGSLITGYTMSDDMVWANQSQYIIDNDIREFDQLKAYGHPGGTIVEGTIIVNKISKLPYLSSLKIFMSLFFSMILALISGICWNLRKNSIWWFSVVIALLFNGVMYRYATPPTAISALLTTLLSLYSLYIYEQPQKLSELYYIIWGIIAGLLIATRADIGIIGSAFLFCTIWSKIRVKDFFYLLSYLIFTFIIFDPFMWFMPISHIFDIIHKFSHHYYEFAYMPISFTRVLIISSLSLLSVIFAIFYSSLLGKISPIKPFFLKILISLTIFICLTIFTSKLQTERYFLPLICIWQAFLPIFVFSLIDNIKLPTNKKFLYKILFITLVLVSNIFWFV